MRILHVSDIHAREGHLRWLVRKSGEFDLVCVTGDLLDLNENRPLEEQLERVTSCLGQIRTPLAVCSGNHDSLAGAGKRLEHACWLKELRRESVWVDGDVFELGGFQVRCIPWQVLGPSPAEEEIWLIHAPPDHVKTAIARGGMDFGDFTFGEQCRAAVGPRLALSGHVHDPQSWRAKVGHTWSLNPGYAERTSQPNHISIDLKRGVALLNRASGETDAVRLWSAPW